MSNIDCYCTERLKVQSFQSVDSDDFFVLFNHPLVNPFLGATSFFSRPHLIRSFLEQMSFKKNNLQSWILYSIFNKMSHQFIGGCGFKVDLKCMNAEIFYLLFPEYWGKGLAVEACHLLLDNNVFSQFSLKRVDALIASENIRAQRVVAKLGFIYLKMINLNRYSQRRQVQQWTINFPV